METAVTAYTTDDWLKLLLDSTIAGRLPVPVGVKPVTPVVVLTLQVYADPGVDDDQTTGAEATPVQTLWFSGLLLMDDKGFTVTRTVKGAPLHPVPLFKILGVTT